jgi:hypothetical protein
MAKRINPSQYKQAIAKYNNAVRKFNSDMKRNVDNYNRVVRKYNSEQIARRQKLRSAISRFNQSKLTVSYSSTLVLRQSTEILSQRYRSLESYTNANDSDFNSDILVDFPEQETNNSIVLYNSLSGIQDSEYLPQETLQRTVIEDALYQISAELGKRWEGAIFSLNPNNPDAARHFCTSVRDIFIILLDIKAPDDLVKSLSDCTYYNGKPDRRSKIKYLLSLKSLSISLLTDFVDTDIDDLLNLFETLNSGTHGTAGKFDIQQLLKLKKRVEDSIIFITSIVSN